MAKSNPYKTKLAQTNLSKAKNASMSRKWYHIFNDNAHHFEIDHRYKKI